MRTSLETVEEFDLLEKALNEFSFSLPSLEELATEEMLMPASELPSISSAAVSAQLKRKVLFGDKDKRKLKAIKINEDDDDDEEPFSQLF